MILNQIRTAVDPKLRFSHNGFCERQMTVRQILTLRRIIHVEEANKINLPAVLMFTDFKTALDSIHLAAFEAT